MVCDYTEINGKCYGTYNVSFKPRELLYDLLKYEDGTEAVGREIIDEKDLFIPQGAQEATPVPIDKVLWKQQGKSNSKTPTKIVSLGHLFGQRMETLHPAYYTHYFEKDELLIDPYHLIAVEAALVTYDTRKIDIYFEDEIHLPQDEPITDHHPSMPIILCRLRHIATGEKKPLPFLEGKDGKLYSDPKYVTWNQKRAIELVQYYWRMGSDVAGKILDELGVKQEPRFEWVAKKLQQHPSPATSAAATVEIRSCEPHAQVLKPTMQKVEQERLNSQTDFPLVQENSHQKK